MSSAAASAPIEWNEQVAKRFIESFRSQLLQFKVFQECTADVLAAPVHVEVCPRPAYLLPGAWKVRASIAVPHLRVECLCLYCEHDGSGLACLFLKNAPLDAALSAAIGTSQVRSFIDVGNADQALAYFLDFVAAAHPRHGIVVPGPKFSDVRAQWFSPLFDEEIAECNRILRENPVAIAPGSEHQFVIEACVLEGGRLIRRTYTVHRTDEHSRLTGERIEERCHIGIGPTQRSTLCLLHDNYRVEPAGLFGSVKVERLAAEPGWIELPPDEIALIKCDLDRYVHFAYRWPDLPLWCQSPNVTARKRRLSFYERDLLEFRSGEGADVRTAFVLWRPGYGAILDGTSNPIHQVNDDIRSLRERRGEPAEVIRNVDEALEYVRFFCDHVWGDEGPFTIVEGRSAPALQRFTIADRAPRFSSAEDVLNAVSPLRCAADQRSESIVEYRLAGWVAYGTGLYETRLLLHRDGTIEMTDDSPLAELAQRSDAQPLDRRQVYSLGHANNGSLLQLRGVVPAASMPNRGQDCPPIGPDTIENQTIIGPLKMRDLGVRSFRNCRFRSRVDLSGLKTADSLSFVDCVFEGGLSLDNATIDGTLQLISCTLLSNGRSDASFSLDAKHLRADAVEIENVYAARGITMAHAMVLQRVAISELSTDHSVSTALYCYAVHVEHGYFSLYSFRLGGLLDLELARIGTFVAIDSAPGTRSHMGGGCTLHGLRAANIVRIASTDIAGTLGLRSVQTDLLSVRAECNVETPAPVYIGGDIDLRDCLITRHVLIAGVVARSEISAAEQDADHQPLATLNLRHARIGGDLRLFLDRERGAKFAIPRMKTNERHRCVLPHGIDLSNATIEGDIDMAAVACEEGGIDLSDASIACDLLITREPDMPSATALYLTMDGIECAGHADLSGIQITGRGNVSARFGTFGTTLKVANSTDDGADIEGNLDLTGSKINELSISVKSFWLDRQPTDNDLARHAILLKQATIEKVTIHHDDQKYPRPIDLRYANVNWWEFRSRDGASNSDDVEQYKGLLNGDPNRQLHTYRSFEQNLVNRGHEDAADEIYWEMRWWLFTDRLSKTWSQIVPTRDSESSSQATSPSPLTWPLRAIGAAFSLVWQLIIFVAWTLPTSYKRTPAHLLIAIVIWFGVSTAIFSLPANIAPSELGLTADRSIEAGAQPGGWGVSDGAWLALRHHVPIAMFTAREEWEPTNDRPLSIPGVQEPLSWLNAEDYANIVLTLHWLWWPIVLISSSRKYFRRSGQ
jgi:hypothetical protein